MGPTALRRTNDAMPTESQGGLFGPMRAREQGRFHKTELPRGRVLLRVDHDPLPGVTADMMRWWFEHIDGVSTLSPTGWDAPEHPVYRLWHPIDHLCARWKRRIPGPDGRIGPGSILHIEESFRGRFPSRNDVRISRIDGSGFDFELGGGSVSFGSVRHRYSPVDGGIALSTELEFGVQWPGLALPFNKMLRGIALTPAFIDAWVVHNIEECGELPKFLPRLTARQA